MVFITIVVRVCNDIYMLFSPLNGILLSVFWDIMDTYCFILGNFSRKEYHFFDKILDWIHYLFTLVVAYQLPNFTFMLGWFLYRTLGHVIHFFTKDHRVFIIFPNVFEYLVIAELIFIRFSLPYSIKNPAILASIILFKVVHEMYIHLFPLDIQYRIIHRFPAIFSLFFSKKALAQLNRFKSTGK